MSSRPVAVAEHEVEDHHVRRAGLHRALRVRRSRCLAADGEVALFDDVIVHDGDPFSIRHEVYHTGELPRCE